tara:strand:+ start:8242 stop:9843 length:1602 start_codon:yes stop_codon:yes gene_type:complete
MSFDVRLPNAQIITNVPDGTTKAQLKEKLDNSSIISSWENNQSTFTNEKFDVAFYGGTKSLGFSEKDSNQYDTLIQSGVSKEEAYKKTKIMVDVNGNKRHDMDVTNTKFKKFKLNDKNDIMDLSQFKNMGVRETFKTTLGETITHPTLFKNYPFLKDIPLWLINDRKKGFQGAYYGASAKWEGRLGGKRKDGSPTRIEYNTAFKTKDVMRTMIEEIQHLIDDYEDDRPYGAPVADRGNLGTVITEANAESLQDQYDAFKNSGEDKTKIPPYFVDGKVDSKKYEEQFVEKGGKNNRPFLGLYYVKRDKDNNLENIYTNNYDDLLNNSVNIVYHQQKKENPKLSDEEFNKHLIKYVNTKTLFPELGIELKLGDNGKLTYGAIKKNSVARNVRNNNLGNIKITKDKWEGMIDNSNEKTFVTYKTPEFGIRALNIVIDANLNATNSYETYVNRYASELKEKAFFKKNGRLMPHLVNYAKTLANSQGVDTTNNNWLKQKPTNVNKLEWIKATAIAEGGKDSLNYFTDEIITRGLNLKK